MKMKRVLSMALALSLIFGSAAALPEGTFTKSTSITASAEGDTIVSGDYKYKLLTNGTAEITEYTGTDATVTIPSALDTKTVSSIGANAFKDCANLKKVIIPKSVTAIGDGAFDKGCTIVCIPGSKAQEYGAFNGNELEYISGDYLYKDYDLDTVEITGYTGTDTTLTIPSTLADK
ncbi:MAG: leucine-rich repeat protein, partial [Ruminococcus sp.]|nr:leucine-rich repeat protein [Ruminococcus sp.]